MIESWKIAVIAAWSVMVGVAVWWPTSRHYELLIARQEEANQKAVISVQNGVITTERKQQQATSEVSNAYETHVSSIDNQYSAAIAGVQSSPADTAHLPALSASQSGYNAASGGNKLSRQDKVILITLAKTCDVQTARLVACQAWIKAQTSIK